MFGPLYTFVEQTDGFWMPFFPNSRSNVPDIGTEFYTD
jgi:hypothetical protein